MPVVDHVPISSHELRKDRWVCHGRQSWRAWWQRGSSYWRSTARSRRGGKGRRNMEKPSTMEFHGPGASKNSSKADILIFITLPPSFRKFQFHLWSIPKLLVKIRCWAPKLVSNNLSDRPLLYLTTIQLKLFFRFINHHQPPSTPVSWGLFFVSDDFREDMGRPCRA